MSDTHLARAADAASYADRLQTDLVRITAMLSDYRGSPGIDLLHERSHSTQQQLKAIAERLGALGKLADPGRYPLNEAEHIALEAACDLRERLMESLSRYQRATFSNRKPA